MDRFVLVHGHFYQPPRENPWLEAVEVEDSAYPYHDWNSRVTAESYAPNAAARILDRAGRITTIANNYERISFNFGPTLLSWLECQEPDVYGKILRADQISRERFSGHGSAVAQAYGHIIMPLANQRDKQTQILWGAADFRHRFERQPEGMWLPETAVDLETLDLLAREGIRFTILAPHQAARIRRLAGGDWESVEGGRLDPRHPYLCRLPSGGSIAIFFYDQKLAHAVAFEGLLNDGVAFADRLVAALGDEGPALAHVATDGETYGHHHRHGEMALAKALSEIEARSSAHLTNYGEFLERFPPTHEVEIRPATSWSCSHGVERWRSDCGCATGGDPGWNQAWRRPLREALDALRDETIPLFEGAAGKLLADPWAARDDYISVVLDRSPDSVDVFFERQAARPLNDSGRERALALLELERHAMSMFTSCGWFFNDISGIETIQVLRYAGRVLQLARDLLDVDLEPAFRERLAAAKSNIAERGDGSAIYDRYVRPTMVALPDVGAHYAVSSLFESYSRSATIYCFRAERVTEDRLRTGRVQLAMGQVLITSELTAGHLHLSYGALHFGDHSLSCGVREFRGGESYQKMVETCRHAFERADLAGVIRGLDQEFEELTYSLESLFKDEQRKVIHIVLEATLSEIEAEYSHIYDQHAQLIRFLSRIGTPLPRPLASAAEFVLDRELKRLFADPEADPAEAVQILSGSSSWGLKLDAAGLAYDLAEGLEQLAFEWLESAQRLELLERLDAKVAMAVKLPFNVPMWETQNIVYQGLKQALPPLETLATQGNENARRWVEQARALAVKLSIEI